jgi:two-component system LytT family response regulator/two-component system response regulator LytT
MAGSQTAPITAVVVDDEQPALDEILYLLKEHTDVEVLASASNGLEAVDLIEKLEPDMAILDVQMPGLDGLGVIRRLKTNGAALPYFILATGFDHYAVEAFRLEALDYLLKPVEKDRLAESLERARRVAAERSKATAAEPVEEPRATPRTKLLVRSGGRHWMVDSSDLIYATISNGMITLVTTSVEGEASYKTIEELQSNLDPETFWRVHRSYLININRIREVIPWFKSSFQLRMDDKKQSEIPVSRVQTRRLREMLKL